MGEFIKHPETGVEIKIATLDHCFFSRDELLQFKRKGFKGFYRGTFDVEAGRKDTLDLALEDPLELFKLPAGCPFDPKIHTIKVKNNGFKHGTVILHKKGNRGSVYVYTDLKCRQEKDQVIYAVMIGERFDSQGRARTIFQCDCCESFFSVTASEAAYLKARFPTWAEWIKPNLKDGEA